MGNGRSDANIEVTSQQLLDELREIKDRVGALENVAGIANQDVLEKFFREELSTDARRAIMDALREPSSKAELQSRLNYNSPQALDYHLTPLRESLVHSTHQDGVERFEWSLLFKRMQKRKIEDMLAASEKPRGESKTKHRSH